MRFSIKQRSDLTAWTLAVLVGVHALIGTPEIAATIAVPWSVSTLYAFGYSGNGMTYAHIAAIMFRDTVTGVKNLWLDVYNPSRIPGPTALYVKGKDYIRELAGGAIKNSFASRDKKSR